MPKKVIECMSMEKIGDELIDLVPGNDPEKREADMLSLLDVETDIGALEGIPFVAESGALIKDEEVQNRRAGLTQRMREYAVRECIGRQMRGKRSISMPGQIGRTNSSIYQYFQAIGMEEFIDRYEKTMEIKETRTEQYMRLRAQGRSHEEAEKETDEARRQDALRRGKLLEEMMDFFDEQTPETLLKDLTDEEIVAGYPMFAFMQSFCGNLDRFSGKDTDKDLLLSEDGRKKCEYLRSLQPCLTAICNRANIILNPYYKYLDNRKISECGNKKEFEGAFGDFCTRKEPLYAAGYGMSIALASGSEELARADENIKPLGEYDDFADSYIEKLDAKTEELGFGEGKRYTDENHAGFESEAELKQYLYEGRTVTVTEGDRTVEIRFSATNAKVVKDSAAHPDTEQAAEDYAGMGTQKKFDRLFKSFMDADPALMKSSPQFKAMRETLEQYAKVYQKGAAGLKNSMDADHQRKLLIELFEKAQDYLKYKGTSSSKPSTKLRITAAQNIQTFVLQQLPKADLLVTGMTMTEEQEARERNRHFCESGKAMLNEAHRSLSVNPGMLAVRQRLEQELNEENGIFAGLRAGKPDTDARKLGENERRRVENFLEDLVIHAMVQKEEQQNADNNRKLGIYGALLYKDEAALRTIIKNTGSIQHRLEKMTCKKLEELITDPSGSHEMAQLISRIEEKTNSKVTKKLRELDRSNVQNRNVIEKTGTNIANKELQKGGISQKK